ncbi:hypothetical protein WJX75_003799 [Coccomyxa subellipsoidea]|uniref:Uncharacterized protein n=1 Tax=Coccomyxa subellipsoidea TaxID=248742 RepID=A0ABR2YMC0_9CHLO
MSHFTFLLLSLMSIARIGASRPVLKTNSTAAGPSQAPAVNYTLQFIQRAAFADLWFDPTSPEAPGSLVLKGISPHTTFYSTSPVRTAGIFSTTAFVSQPRFYSVRQNAAQWLGAPNAALLSGSQGPYLADSIIILTLNSVSYNSTMDTATYEVDLVMDDIGLPMDSAGEGNTAMGREIAKSAEWLASKQPSESAADRVQAATDAQSQSEGEQAVDPVLHWVDVALHIGPWEVSDMPQ